jgi:hypothetical protein
MRRIGKAPYFIRRYRDLIRRSRFARMLDGYVSKDMSGRRRQQKDAIGEPDRFLDIVGHNERRHWPVKNEFGELAAQSISQCRVKRDEWFVQNQKIGFDREGAG